MPKMLHCCVLFHTVSYKTIRTSVNEFYLSNEHFDVKIRHYVCLCVCVCKTSLSLDVSFSLRALIKVIWWISLEFVSSVLKATQAAVCFASKKPHNFYSKVHSTSPRLNTQTSIHNNTAMVLLLVLSYKILCWS